MKRSMVMYALGLAVVLASVAASGTRAARADIPAARKACTDAMNADPGFAQSVIATANQELASKIHNYDITFSQLQEDAAARVAKNERHVFMAYAAMWIAAAVFVGFLWRRQRGLKDQIARLSADLDKALADDAGAKKTS